MYIDLFWIHSPPCPGLAGAEQEAESSVIEGSGLSTGRLELPRAPGCCKCLHPANSRLEKLPCVRLRLSPGTAPGACGLLRRLYSRVPCSLGIWKLMELRRPVSKKAIVGLGPGPVNACRRAGRPVLMWNGGAPRATAPPENCITVVDRKGGTGSLPAERD